jgi:hypothetical protein
MAWIRLADLPEQKVLNTQFAEIVYWELRDGSVWHQGRKLRSASAQTFEVRTDDHVFLARDETQVFHAWSRLKGVDRDSFEVLNEGYCRDKSLAYCEFETSLKPLKGRDVKKFVVLGNGYARDSVHSYYCGKPIRSCTTPLTLTLPEQVDQDFPLPYALDRDRVYFESAALKDVDVKRWRLMDDGFSADAKRVYFGAKKLARVQIDSWEHADGAYSRDNKSVFVMHLRLPGADPTRWRKLSSDYSTDGRHVYFVDRPLKNVDVDSFEITSATDEPHQTARDKHGTFRGSERDE